MCVCLDKKIYIYCTAAVLLLEGYNFFTYVIAWSEKRLSYS